MAKHLNLSLGFTADVSGAKKALQDLEKTLTSIVNTTAIDSKFGLTDDIKEAIAAASELKIKLNQATTSSGNLDLSKFNKSLKDSGKNLSNYADDLSALGPEGAKAFSQLTQSILTAEIPLKRSNKLLNEFATTLKNTARWQISSSILHGLAGGIQSAVYYAQDLNESLNNIRIVTGASVDEMSRFAKEANAAAKALSTTTTEYTNAALIYYQQGDAEEMVKQKADITVKLANVTRQSAEAVSDQLTSIWNNFAESSDELEHFADVLVRLGADTASSSDEISQGLEKFAAIGSTIGLSYENAAAALATVTAQTRQSADVVGTAFKTIFARIQGLNLGETLDDGTSLNKYSEALLKVGINIKDQTGQMKDMDIILDEMGEKWGSLNKDQQIALAQTVAGVRQYNQLMALMDNWDFYEKNLESAKEADGSLQEQSIIYAEGWEAASDRVKASLEGVYQSILDDEAFIDILNAIADIVDLIETFADSMGGMRGVLLLVSNLMMKTFSKDIVNSISDAMYNIRMGTKKGRAELEQTRKDAIKAQKDLLMTGTEFSGAETDVFSRQAELQETLLKKAHELQDLKKDLTDEERKHAQALLDSNKLLGEAYLKTVQIKEESESKSNSQTRSLSRSVYGLDNGNLESYSKQFKTLTAQVKIHTVLNDVQDRYVKSGDKGLETIRKRFIAISKSVEDTNTELSDEFMSALRSIDNNSSFEDIEKALKAMTSAISEAEGELGELETEIEGVAQVANDPTVFRQGLSQMTDSSREAGNAMADMVLQGANLEESFSHINEKFNQFSGGTTTLQDALSSSMQAATSLAFGLSQAAEAGSQLFDPEVDGLQKFISTIMLLNTAIDVYKTTSEAATMMESLFGQAKAANIPLHGQAAATKKLEEVATKGVTAETQKETAAVNANKIAWMTHPVLAIVSVALMAVVGVISAVTQAIENNTQAAVDNANATYDNVKAKQEECDVNKDLIKSYNELLTSYKETGEGKQDLIDSGLQLTDIYKIEGGAVMLLAGQYDKLKKAIREARVEELKNQQKEIDKGKADTVKAMGKKLVEGDGDVVGNTYYGTFDNGMTDADEFMLEALQKNRGKYGNFLQRSGGEVQFQVDDYTDPQQLLEYIETLKEFKSDMEDIARAEGADIGASEGYKDVIAELETVQELYNQLKEYSDTEDQYDLELATLTAEVNGKSVDDVNNIKDYLELEKQVANSIKDETVSQEEKLAIAREYLSTYEHLGALATKSQAFNDITNDKNKEEIEKIKQYYETLSDEEQEVFWSIGIDEDSTVAEVKSAIADAQDYLDANSLYATIELNDQLKKAWESQNYDELKKLIESGDFGITWDDFLKMSPSDIEDFIEGSAPDFDAIIKSQEEALANHETALTQAETDLKNAESELEEATKKVLEIKAALEGEKNTANYQLWNARNIVTDDGMYWTQSGADSILSIDPNNELFANNAEFQELYKVLSSYSKSGMINLDTANMDILAPLFEGLETGKYAGRAIQDKLLFFAQGNDDILEELFTRLVGDAVSNVGELEINLEEANGIKSEAEKKRNAAEGEVNRLSTEDTTLLQNKLETQVKAKKAFEEKIKQYNLDEKTIKALAKSYEQYGNTVGIVTDQVQDNTIAAYQEAIAVGRLNKGYDDLKSQYENISWVLENNEAGTMDYQATLSELYTIIGNIANIDGESLSENFYANNIDLIRQAAEGSIEALDRLRAVAKLDSLRTEWTLDDKLTPELETAMSKAEEYIRSHEFEVGVNINEGPFFEACQKIVTQAGMTADAAARFFGSMGFNAEVITTRKWISDPNGPSVKNGSGLKGDVQAVNADGGISGPAGGERGYWLTVPTVKFISKNNSTGGNISSSEDEMGDTKEPYDNFSDLNSIRKDFNENNLRDEEKALKKINKELEKTNKQIDKVYGRDKLNAIDHKIELLKKENIALEKQIDTLKENTKVNQDFADELESKINPLLKEIGSEHQLNLEYDEEGILNAEASIKNVIVSLAMFEIESQGEVDEEVLKNIETLKQLLSLLQEVVGDLDGNYDAINEAQTKIDDNLNEIKSEKYHKLEYELEIKVDLDESKLEIIDAWLDIYADKINHMGEAVATLFSKLNLNESLINTYQEQFNKLQSMQGELHSEDYVAGLKEVRDGLLSQVSALTELDDQMMHYYSDTLDLAQEEIDDMVDHMEHLTSVFDHYLNLMDLLGKSKDYEVMGNFLQGRADTIKDRLDVATSWYKELEQQKIDLEAKMANTTDEAALELYREEWDALIDTMDAAQAEALGLTEEWVEAEKAIIENNMAKTADTLEKTFTDGLGFDELMSQYDRLNTVQEEYLTKTNQMYETNKLMTQASRALDKTDNEVSKQKLRNFMEETKGLQETTKLSKYQLSVQQAKYELLQAEMALEDAKNAKSTVRLQRDSSGNYGYVYTADQDAIADAEQKVADAENNLYNISLQGQQEYTEKYMQAMQDFYSQLEELRQARMSGEIATDEEYNQRREALVEAYFGDGGILQTYSSIYREACETDNNAVAENWASNFGAMTQRTDEWKENVNSYIQSVDSEFENWKEVTVNANNLVKGALDNSKKATEDLRTESNNLAKDIQSNLIPTLGQQMTAVAGVTSQYAMQRAEVLNLISTTMAYIAAVNAAIAAASQLNTMAGSGSAFDTSIDYSARMYEAWQAGDMAAYEQAKKDRETKISITGNDYGATTEEVAAWIEAGNQLEKGQYISELVKNGMATGGYTGAWGPEGRIALLHEKELVLNQDDTTNILKAIDLIRDFDYELDDFRSRMLTPITSPRMPDFGLQPIEKIVQIEANFPNVSDRYEIEEAFNSLINHTSQYIASIDWKNRFGR